MHQALNQNIIIWRKNHDKFIASALVNNTDQIAYENQYPKYHLTILIILYIYIKKIYIWLALENIKKEETYKFYS
jgi:hypothetical protein